MGEGDLESCWQTWKDLFLAAVKDNIPTKRLRGGNPVPWLTSAVVVIAGVDVVLRPGPKYLDTTIDLAPVGVIHASVDRFMAISTQRPQRHWTQLKKTQQQ